MTPPADPGLVDELHSLACELAVAAGEHARAAGRPTASATSTKSTLTDLVTVSDRAAESLIVAGLAAARPDDAVVGEEGTDRRGTTGITWHLDPIDGTTNFVYGLPSWCTSIAAADDDGVVAGAVYVPVTGELFAARRHGGATLDGEPIRCRATDDVALALVATGFAYTPARRRAQAAVVADLLPRVRDVRRLGSAAIDLCYAAAGRLDGYYEDHLNQWDIAAGALIAAEAGCRVTVESIDGAGLRLVAAAPRIFDDLVALLHR